MKMNSQLAGTSSVPPESLSMRVSRSRWSPPEAAATSLRHRTSMFGAASIRVMRYWDIVAASVPALATSTTRAAYRARFRAAWPAELAAPTM
jgi:hypothetical protein